MIYSAKTLRMIENKRLNGMPMFIFRFQIYFKYTINSLVESQSQIDSFGTHFEVRMNNHA